MKILIADDNAQNLKLLRAQLESEGFKVASARDGVEALAVLEREDVDALVTDVLMPNMDGYRLCYKVRKNEKFKNLPIIVYSSTHSSKSDKELAINCGADIFLEKPTPTKKMVEGLRELFQKSERNEVAAKLPADIEVMKQYSELLIRKLEEKSTQLEAKVSELQRFVDVTVDREDRMIELKKEVNALCKEFGRTEPYDLSFEESP